jgi:hypothetical protein
MGLQDNAQFVIAESLTYQVRSGVGTELPNPDEMMGALGRGCSSRPSKSPGDDSTQSGGYRCPEELSPGNRFQYGISTHPCIT